MDERKRRIRKKLAIDNYSCQGACHGPRIRWVQGAKRIRRQVVLLPDTSSLSRGFWTRWSVASVCASFPFGEFQGNHAQWRVGGGSSVK